jgi:hypothetical protein
MDQGSLHAALGPFSFVVSGTKTSINPLTAFRQGLSDEPGGQTYRVTAGHRCRGCGYLELYTSPEP